VLLLFNRMVVGIPTPHDQILSFSVFKGISTFEFLTEPCTRIFLLCYGFCFFVCMLCASPVKFCTVSLELRPSENLRPSPTLSSLCAPDVVSSEFWVFMGPVYAFMELALEVFSL
jgi:hypothetical protein